jgi:hypothetical protein
MLRRHSRLSSHTRLRPYRLKPRRGRIEDRVYLKWIRSQPCLIRNRECRGPTDPHHVGHFGQARTNDYSAVPLCRRHHDLAQQIHQGPFEERYGVSFAAAITALNEEYRVLKGKRDQNTRVEPDVPPIPDRSCDRTAWVDGQEETTSCTGAIASNAHISPAVRIDESTQHDRRKEQSMAEYLRFSTNVAVEVALRFPEGKQVQSKLEGGADQMMYSLADGRVMYVPLHVGERIRELHIGPGERFSLIKAEVKTGNRRGIEWKVTRVDPLPEPPQPAAPAAPKAAKPAGAAAQPTTPAQTGVPAQSTASDNGERKTQINGNGNGHATLNGIPYWDPKTELMHCYDDAIGVLVTVRDTAAKQGLPVQFTGEDLRQVAATLYIDRGKDRRTPWNGGAR